MEKLKDFQDLWCPDPRSYAFATYDEQYQAYRPVSSKDIYNAISALRLHEGVPSVIRDQFEMARNMYAYSWFYYPLNSEAGFLAIRITEQALKKRLGVKKRTGLKALAFRAIEDGLLTSEGFTVENPNQALIAAIEEITGKKHTPVTEFPIDQLPGMLATFRNSPAHGEASLHPTGIRMIRLAAETINQLFERPNEEDSDTDIEQAAAAELQHS